MSKEDTPVGTIIRGLVDKIIEHVAGKPIEVQTDITVTTQDHVLSEDSRREIENMSDEI